MQGFLRLPEDFLILKAKSHGLTSAETNAFILRFGSNKSDFEISEALNISPEALRTRMTNIYKKFNVGGVGPGKFTRLRDRLVGEYHNQSIANAPATQNGALLSHSNGAATGTDLELLVRQLREGVRDRIQHDCGKMQLLVLRRNVDVEGVYIATHLRAYDSHADSILDEEMLEGGAEGDEFERLRLQHLASQRFPGEEIVQTHKRLLIYGKPGSGKTTYLQRLATLCSEGSLFSAEVPVFLTFKDFVEAENRPSLQAYIEKYFADCQVPQAAVAVSRLLMEGRLFLLLDGLDEVYESDRKWVRSQVRDLISRFNQCRFIFSCRPPLRMQLPGFEEVIVADFDRKQIALFAQQWFSNIHSEREVNGLVNPGLLNTSERSQQFMDQLRRNIALAELAKTPLLLTLLCLVFREDGLFPTSRADLYQRGIKILLEQWDAFRNVERSNGQSLEPSSSYRQLNPRAKEMLLRDIAVEFFLREKVFFLQRDVEILIERFYQKYYPTHYSTDPMSFSASEVLEGIELQHGLLVSRGSNCCSFSHLTFQEYFTARALVDVKKQDLVYRHLLEPRWQFVIELVAELLEQPAADSFLEGFKRSLDQLIQGNEKVRSFVEWLEAFVNAVAPTLATEQLYKHTLLRAWYFVFTLEDTGTTSNIPRRSGDRLHFPDYSTATSFLSNEVLDLHMLFYRAFHASLDQPEAFVNMVRRIQKKVQHDIRLATSIDNWMFLIDQERNRNFTTAMQWWEAKRPYWQDRVQKFMRSRFNLQCGWSFSEDEKQLLKSYYHATKLLAECLNRSQKATPDLRRRLSSSLLKVGIEDESE